MTQARVNARTGMLWGPARAECEPDAPMHTYIPTHTVIRLADLFYSVHHEGVPLGFSRNHRRIHPSIYLIRLPVSCIRHRLYPDVADRKPHRSLSKNYYFRPRARCRTWLHLHIFPFRRYLSRYLYVSRYQGQLKFLTIQRWLGPATI